MKRLLRIVSFCAIVATGCVRQASIVSEPFGVLSSGEEVTLWRLVNKGGATMELIDYGSRVVKICMPDRDGMANRRKYYD